jgi:hypothetical protein
MSIIDRVDRLTRLAGRNRLELLLFKLQSEQVFGINVFKVREVLKCPVLRPIPHSHFQMRGVFHARIRRSEGIWRAWSAESRSMPPSFSRPRSRCSWREGLEALSAW